MAVSDVPLRRVVPIAPGELAAVLRRWETAWANAARYLPDGMTAADAVPLLVLYDRLRAFGIRLDPEVVALMESVRCKALPVPRVT